MDLIISLLIIVTLVSLLIIIYMMLEIKKQSERINSISVKRDQFLESIEKYIEIFNEQNVKNLLDDDQITKEDLASKKIASIRKDYQEKLISKNNVLTEEHEMLIDFVTLSLSLLIKTPPSYRLKLIDDNTDNGVIKKILTSKLQSINNHYIPISILEVAISKDG